MFWTGPRHVYSSRVIRNSSSGDSTLTRALLRQWREMRAARPASATAATTTLLEETVTQLGIVAPLLPSSQPSSQSTAAPSSSTSSSPSTPASASAASAETIFHSKRDAALIWQTLQRQRVPWQQALALLPWQLQAMSNTQRSFVTQSVRKRPWDVARIVRAAEDAVDDTRLVEQFRAMRRATYTVEYARLLSAALRERPDLPDGLLPLPHGVMEHGYELGRRSQQDAALMLRLSKQVTLLGKSALSRTASERLVLGHAALEGQVGNWAAALTVVSQSRSVRLSVRRGFEHYVSSLCKAEQHGSQRSTHTAKNSDSARDSDKSSIQRGLCGDPLHHRSDDVSGVIVEKNSLMAQADECTATWVNALHAFLAQPPDRQTYAEARNVLAVLPPLRMQQPDAVRLTTAVLRHAARRMYSGTLTRRLVSCTRKAEWMSALSLATAARCYDVAAPLVSLVPRAVALPRDLEDYLRTVQHLEREKRSVKEGDVVSTSPMLPPTRATAASLSYPQALAYALVGDASTRAALLAYCPQSQPLTRLRSLLLATRQADAAAVVDLAGEDVAEEVDAVECHTFQSSALSQLVCAAASAKRQRYFYKVIPSAIRAHHFLSSPLTAASPDDVPFRTGNLTHRAPAARTDTVTSTSVPSASITKVPVSVLQDRLLQWRQLRSATDAPSCAALLSDLSEFLRATHTVEGEPLSAHAASCRPRLTERVFLQSLATVISWGAVQLPATERFHWSLAVLQAACLLRVSLDAAAVSATARSIPSMFVDTATRALPAVLAAHTLLGQWRAALQMCTRLQRKEAEGTLRLENARRTITDKYVPPPPSVREAMAQVGYAALAPCAIAHWKALDASTSPSSSPPPVPSPSKSRVSTRSSVSFPLLLLELRQYRDSRQLCEEVRATAHRASSRHSHNEKLTQLSRRRMLVGAAFTLLNDEAALQPVVRACGADRVRAEDLDGHGLQRLLSVLPPPTVSSVLAAEVSEGRCAHTHWLVACLSHQQLPLADVVDGARLRPDSSTLSAIACCRSALAGGDVLICLKALTRLAEEAADHPAQRTLLLCIARLLRMVLEDDVALQACMLVGEADLRAGGEALASQLAFHVAQKLFNRLQEVAPLSTALKEARRIVRPVLGTPDFHQDARLLPSPHATWVLLTSVYVATSHVVQTPVPASVVSHLLLRSVASADTDWQAALFFFNELRRPTVEERAALVQALRGTAVAPLLLQHRRFMRQQPEQLMIWADEASGPRKWELSLALLTAELEKSSSSEKEATATPPVLSPTVEAAVLKWNADECVRAAQLLRRHECVRMYDVEDRTLKGVYVQERDPRARRQVQAIVALLQKGAARGGGNGGVGTSAAPSSFKEAPKKKREVIERSVE